MYRTRGTPSIDRNLIWACIYTNEINSSVRPTGAPNLDTSGNRCAKHGSNYPIKCPSPDIKANHFFHIFNATFSPWSQSLCGEQVLKIFAQSIAWLLVGISPQTKLKILRSVTRSWIQLAHPIPDPTQIFSVRSIFSTPTMTFTFG